MKFRSRYYRLWGDTATANKWADNKTGSWRTERPEINKEKCCRCGWCYFYCPTGCIAEKNDTFEPNLDYCKGCGVCEVECPVEAIKMHPEVRREKTT